MKPFLHIMVWLALATSIFAEHPADQVIAAARDIMTFPPHKRPYIRYLDLSTIPKEKRPELARVLNAQVNMLSREPDRTPLRVVDPDYSLLSLNYLDYAWSKEVFDATKEEDPYFHVASFDPNTKARKFLLAPWLSSRPGDQAHLAALVQYSQAESPILNGLWFLNQTGAVANRAKAHYYDFLSGKVGGLKTIDDFRKIVAFDKKLADIAGGILRSAVADSGVSEQPRAIGRAPSVTGAFIYTLDSARSLGVANPLQNLGRDIDFHFDATEVYATLSNGLWAMFLANSKGEAQASAPDFVGKDSRSLSNDGRIMVPVSCIRCHSGPGGLRDVEDWVRNLLQSPLSANVIGKKNLEEEVRTFRREYTRSLETYMRRDKAVYEEAIQYVTRRYDSHTGDFDRKDPGWDGKIFAQKYDYWWSLFENGKVDIQWAARDMGTTPEKVKNALLQQSRGGAGDPILSVWLLEGPRLRTIPIRQYLEAYPRLWEIMIRFPS